MSYREPSYKHGAADQQKEHNDLWGLDYGDTDREKAGKDSTYRYDICPNKSICRLTRIDSRKYLHLVCFQQLVVLMYAYLTSTQRELATYASLSRCKQSTLSDPLIKANSF